MPITWGNPSVTIYPDELLSQEAVAAAPQPEEKAPPANPVVTGTLSESKEETFERKRAHDSAADRDYFKKFTAEIQISAGDKWVSLSLPAGKERCRDRRPWSVQTQKVCVERSCHYELMQVNASPDLNRVVFVISKTLTTTVSQPYKLYKDKFFATLRHRFDSQPADSRLQQEPRPVTCCKKKRTETCELVTYDRATGKTEHFELSRRTLLQYYLKNKRSEYLAHSMQHGIHTFTPMKALRFDAKSPDHLWIAGYYDMAIVHFTPEETVLRRLNYNQMCNYKEDDQNQMVVHPSLPYLVLYHHAGYADYLYLFKQEKNDYEFVLKYEKKGRHSRPFAFVAGTFVVCVNDIATSDEDDTHRQIMSYDLHHEVAFQTKLKTRRFNSCYADETDQLCCVDARSKQVTRIKLKSMEEQRQARTGLSQHLGTILPLPRALTELIAAYSNPLPGPQFFTLERSFGAYPAFKTLTPKQRVELTKHYFGSNVFERNVVFGILRHAETEKLSFEESAVLFLHQSASGFPKDSALLQWLQEAASHAPRRPTLGGEMKPEPSVRL